MTVATVVSQLLFFFVVRGVSSILEGTDELLPENPPHLHDDIIFNILSRLPAETVYSLRCVCKSWYNLISSPFFIQNHLRQSPPSLLQIVYHSPESPSLFSKTGLVDMVGRLLGSIRRQPCITLPRLDTNLSTKHHHQVKVVRNLNVPPCNIWATCNGLVLFGSFSGTVCEPFIANPVTKRVVRLPPLTLRSEYSMFQHVLGLTFIASTGKYKLIHVFNSETKNLLGCEVLTLGDENNAWRLAYLSHISELLWCPSPNMIFIKDVAHWMVYQSDDTTQFSATKFVLSFDMIEEKFYKTKYPSWSYGVDQLLDIGGHVSFAAKITRTQFELWSLKDLFQGNWVQQHRIELEGVEGFVCPHAALENGQVIIFKQVGEPFCYYAYDIQLKQTKYLNIDSRDLYSKVLPHIGTLVPCGNAQK